MVFAQSPFFSFAAIIAGIGLISLILRAVLQSGRRHTSLPPGDFPCFGFATKYINWLTDYRTGPPTVPFFGNELQIPKSDAHFQYADSP